jgi:hypothetical protein
MDSQCLLFSLTDSLFCCTDVTTLRVRPFSFGVLNFLPELAILVLTAQGVLEDMLLKTRGDVKGKDDVTSVPTTSAYTKGERIGRGYRYTAEEDELILSLYYDGIAHGLESEAIIQTIAAELHRPPSGVSGRCHKLLESRRGRQRERNRMTAQTPLPTRSAERTTPDEGSEEAEWSGEHSLQSASDDDVDFSCFAPGDNLARDRPEAGTWDSPPRPQHELLSHGPDSAPRKVQKADAPVPAPFKPRNVYRELPRPYTVEENTFIAEQYQDCLLSHGDLRECCQTVSAALGRSESAIAAHVYVMRSNPVWRSYFPVRSAREQPAGAVRDETGVPPRGAGGTELGAAPDDGGLASERAAEGDVLKHPRGAEHEMADPAGSARLTKRARRLFTAEEDARIQATLASTQPGQPVCRLIAEVAGCLQRPFNSVYNRAKRHGWMPYASHHSFSFADLTTEVDSPHGGSSSPVGNKRKRDDSADSVATVAGASVAMRPPERPKFTSAAEDVLFQEAFASGRRSHAVVRELMVRLRRRESCVLRRAAQLGLVSPTTLLVAPPLPAEQVPATYMGNPQIAPAATSSTTALLETPCRSSPPLSSKLPLKDTSTDTTVKTLGTAPTPTVPYKDATQAFTAEEDALLWEAYQTERAAHDGKASVRISFVAELMPRLGRSFAQVNGRLAHLLSERRGEV